MNYYEELGLTESASVEEIRQAYKSLARLLHPDHQCNDQLRKVAELQMTRLNEILAVLTDRRGREKYDASIREAAATTPPCLAGQEAPGWKSIHPGPLRIRVGTIVWSASLVVAAVGFSFALLYFEHGSAVLVNQGNSSQRTLLSPAAAPVASPIHARAAVPDSERRIKRIVQADEIDPPTAAPVAPITAAQESAPPYSSQLTTSTAAAVRDFDRTQLEETRTNPIPTIPLAVDVPDRIGPLPGPKVVNGTGILAGPLIGTWLYSKSNTEGGPSSGSVYRPEYVEMVVKSEENGKISGRYLGRFHVPDQALSSEVSFAFEGEVGEGTTVLTWRGGDGAEGRVRLKMTSGGAVEVAWYTTRFGTDRKLASGTAVLRRD